MVIPKGSITLLKTAADHCNESVIERLNHVLERAKAGEVVAVGIAYVLHSGAISTTWSSSEPAAPLLGAIALLQHEFISSD
jgi:hypothetical protein